MSRPVYVKEHGVLLPSGDSSRALLCATLAGISAVNVIKDLAVAVGSDPRAHFPRLACLPEALEWETALQDTLERLLAQKQPVLLVMPKASSPQYPWIQEVLTLADPGGLIHRVDEAALPQALVGQVERLQAGDIPGVSVLGVDSLTHPVMVMELAARAGLQTDKSTEGRAVGEGFAWFSLTTKSAAVEWLASAVGEEPNADADLPAPLQGLAKTVTALCQDDAPARPRLVIHARTQTAQDDLEWHHTEQRLWPLRLPPRDNLAMRKGDQLAPQPAPLPWQQHLKPAGVVGEVGAAALPMAVALACERLCWPLSPAREALVVDAGQQPGRCAVWLKNTESQGGDHNE